MKRTFVFGDIHGCYDEFITLVKQIGIADNDLIVSVGDIVDRGNKSFELYQYFQNNENAILLMGNHERKHKNGVLSYAQEIVKIQFGESYDEFVQWLDSVPYYHETEDAIIVHAYYEHDKDLENQKEEVLAGTTSGSRYLEEKYPEGKYWHNFYSGAKPIIYGHHVVGENPEVENNTYGIDTGACHGMMLTAIELPGFKIHQVAVEKDYWHEERIKWQIPVLRAKNWETMKIEQIRKQIAKLNYKKENEIVDFLNELNSWLESLEELLNEIKIKIEEISNNLKSKNTRVDKKEIAKLPYSSFLFKALSNNFQLKDLTKGLDTPSKIISIAQTLDLNTPILIQNT